jgi:hypothetical protein
MTLAPGSGQLQRGGRRGGAESVGGFHEHRHPGQALQFCFRKCFEITV